MFQRLQLKTKITLINGGILLTIAFFLTLISINNAKSTYGDQLNLSFGDAFSISVNDTSIEIGGNSKLSDWFRFLMELDEDKESKEGFINQANKDFASESLLAMMIISLLGVSFTYIFVSKALVPLRELSKSMRNIDENNLNDHLKFINQKDEIGVMTQSYNKMLDRLNKSFQNQKNFAANAAHELKTPLSAMKASIQVLKIEDSPTIDDYKETIDIMEQSTERLIHVVEDLLNLTKETDHDMNEVVEIDQIIDVVLDELALTAQKKEIQLFAEPCNMRVVGNQVLLYRALFNLVENAIKYNHLGGYVKVYVKEDNSKVQIIVKDNGIGMSKDDMHNIFEPFYRVDKSRSRVMGGSGLGLSIVKTIIENHGGTIKVDSIEGVGSEFIITLIQEYHQCA